MKRNTGRPPKQPVGEVSTVTMRVSADLKRMILAQASAYDMTITEYVSMLVKRDVGGCGCFCCVIIDRWRYE
jgi:hypothetical protein